MRKEWTRRLRFVVAWLGVLVLLGASSVQAKPPVELGGYLGGALPLGGGLGNPYFADQQPNGSVALGLRAGWWLLPAVSAELAFDYTPTSTPGSLTAGRPGIAATLLGLHASGRYTLWPARQWKPFAVGGASVLGYFASAPSHYAVQSPDLDVGAHWGLGIEGTLPVPMMRTFRVDLRHIVVPAQDRTYSVLGLNLGATLDLFGEVHRLTRSTEVTPVVTQAPQAAPPPAPAEPLPTRETPEPQPPVRQVVGSVTFELDSAAIRDADHALLDQLVSTLTEAPEARLEVGGHSDQSGEAIRNTRLSRERADAVRWYLVDQGVSAERIVTIGHGPDLPVASNDSAEGRARNRRSELILIRPGG